MIIPTANGTFICPLTGSSFDLNHLSNVNLSGPVKKLINNASKKRSTLKNQQLNSKFSNLFSELKRKAPNFSCPWRSKVKNTEDEQKIQNNNQSNIYSNQSASSSSTSVVTFKTARTSLINPPESSGELNSFYATNNDCYSITSSSTKVSTSYKTTSASTTFSNASTLINDESNNFLLNQTYAKVITRGSSNSALKEEQPVLEKKDNEELKNSHSEDGMPKIFLMNIFSGLPPKELEDLFKHLGNAVPEEWHDDIKKANLAFLKQEDVKDAWLNKLYYYNGPKDPQNPSVLKAKEISGFEKENIMDFSLKRISKSILRPSSLDCVFKLLKEKLKERSVDNHVVNDCELLILAKWISKESVKKSPIKLQLTKNVQTGETLQLLNDAKKIAEHYKKGSKTCDLSGGHFSKLPEDDVFSPEIRKLNLSNNPSLTTLRSYLKDKPNLKLVNLTNTPKLKADDTTADIVTTLRDRGSKVKLDADLEQKLVLKQTDNETSNKFQENKKINMSRYSETFLFKLPKIKFNRLSISSTAIK